MVKRYHFDEDDRNIFGCRDGEYVDYDNYAKLEAENKRLKQELSRMSKPISVKIPPVVWDHDDLEEVIKKGLEERFGFSDKYAKLEVLCDRLANNLREFESVKTSQALAAYHEFKEEE